MTTQKKLQPGDRAKKVAIKNAAAQFSEIRRICDDFDNSNDITLDQLNRLVRDVDFAVQALRNVAMIWSNTPSVPSGDPVVAKIVDQHYNDHL